MSDLLLGKKLGDYQIQRLLGKGGMARVYVGFDERLQRHAAVKVINSDLMVADKGEYAERFRREARAIARLNHPNIVGVYQFGDYETLYYMAMAFIEGRDLRQILRENSDRGTRMPYRDILNIVQGIGAALDYAHSRGVIHRDIKPSNIMLDADNRPVLTDFGLALAQWEGTLGDTFGTAHYIAPEQAVSSAKAVPQSDLYSLGICTYEMLTGKVPFDDPSAMSVALKHLNDAPPPLRTYVPDIPPAVEGVILKAIEKDAARRFANGVEMADALAVAMAHHITDSRPSRRSVLFNDLKLSESQMRRLGILSPTSASNAPTSGASAPRPPIPMEGYSSNAPTSEVKAAKTDAPSLRRETLPVASAGAKRSRRPLILAALLLVGLLAGGLFVFLNRGGTDSPIPTAVAGLGGTGTPTTPEGTAESTPNPTGEGTIAVIVETPPTSATADVATEISTQATGEATGTAAATTKPTQESTNQATEVVTGSAPTVDTALVTVVTNVPTNRASPTATQTITQTRPPPATNTPRRTPTPTASPTASATVTLGPTPSVNTAAQGDLLLIYNYLQLNVINTSGRTLDISKLVFRQGMRGFEASVWGRFAEFPPEALPDKVCFQVGRLDRPRGLPFDECERLSGFRLTSDPGWFWLRENRSIETFAVYQGDIQVATCEVGTTADDTLRRCVITLP